MRIAFVQKLINRLRNKDQKFFEFCVKIFTDKYLGAKKIKYKTMILGSSHFAVAYRAEEGEYNFALPSQDLYYSWNLYEKYNTADVKNIILSFSVFTTGHNMIKSPLASYSIFYKQIFNIPYMTQELADAKELYKDEEKYDNAIKKYLKNPKLPKDFYGSFNTLTTSKKKNKDLLTNAQKHWKCGQYKPNQMQYFFNLLNATKNNNQTFYVVIPPVTSRYKKLIPTSDIIFKDLYEAVKNYNHVRILNYYNSEDFNDKDFLDGDHLSIKGGEKLTSMIKNAMK